MWAHHIRSKFIIVEDLASIVHHVGFLHTFLPYNCSNGIIIWIAHNFKWQWPIWRLYNRCSDVKSCLACQHLIKLHILQKKVRKRSRNITKILYKPSIEVSMSKERTYILYDCWYRYSGNRLNFHFVLLLSRWMKQYILTQYLS